MNKDLLTIVVISEVGTFVLSVSTALFLSGIRWGMMQEKMSNIEKDVSEIKGAFVLKPRE